MPIEALLVCGGKYHDMDHARLELLKHLAEHEDVRTRVAEDYRDTEAIAAADFLVTYTCDVRPSEAEQKVLAEFVSGGGRWFALHGTNALLDFDGTPPFQTPRSHPLLMETLGSQFLGHPPIAPYTVTACSDDPLVEGIEPFEADDELYLCEYHPPLEPLLETRFTGKAPGFAEEDWPDDEPRWVMYRKPVGEGAVLYLTLGHCRGHYDMRPLMDYYPQVERGAWELPVFHELVRRGLSWAMTLSPSET
ncbi:MAG: ThuA domain-containing protein [Myxococcota bacterium]|jgi:type 1 glutamine amidotransferase